MKYKTEFAITKGVFILIVAIVSLFDKLKNIYLLESGISIMSIVLFEVFTAFVILKFIEKKLIDTVPSPIANILNNTLDGFLLILIQLVYFNSQSLVIFNMNFSFIIIILVMKVVENLSIKLGYALKGITYKRNNIDFALEISFIAFMTLLLLNGYPFTFLGKYGRGFILLIASLIYIGLAIATVIKDMIDFKKSYKEMEDGSK